MAEVEAADCAVAEVEAAAEVAVAEVEAAADCAVCVHCVGCAAAARVACGAVPKNDGSIEQCIAVASPC